MKESTRAYIYRVALAGLAVAAAYGLIEGERLVTVGALVGALTNALATRHTSTNAPG